MRKIKKGDIVGRISYGKDIFFVISPNNGKGKTTDKSKQYICSVPKNYLSEANYAKRGAKWFNTEK